ncbi:hypothetical protein PYCC9005_004789 [Savitreella phatthalungensis]
MLVFLALAASVLASLPVISIHGTKFYDPSGNQFFFKGVAYQPTPADPLLDAAACESNFALMHAAGVNSIRVYHVNPWQSHDACMSIADKYGIYLLLDVDTFNTTIEQKAPTWNYFQMTSYQHVVASFAKYNNLLSFIAGNEIVNTKDGTAANPYIRASVRDTKAFIKSQGYRAIPVGYTAADIAEIRPAFQDYLTCGPGDDLSQIDWFGLNEYEWCGQSTFMQSGYAARTAELANYPKPALITESGCNAVQPRTFGDIPAVYSSDMTGVWSGYVVYEWAQEANDYGMVDMDSAMMPHPRPDYYVVSSRFLAASPSGTPLAQYTPSNTVQACATSLSLPPTPSDDGTADWQVGGQALAATTPVSTTSTSSSSAAAATAAARTTSSTTTRATGTTMTTTSSTRQTGGSSSITTATATNNGGATTNAPTTTSSSATSATTGTATTAALGTATAQARSSGVCLRPVRGGTALLLSYAVAAAILLA